MTGDLIVTPAAGAAAVIIHDLVMFDSYIPMPKLGGRFSIIIGGGTDSDYKVGILRIWLVVGRRR